MPIWYVGIELWERTGTPPWLFYGGGIVRWRLRYELIYQERAAKKRPKYG
jgi:hypothetical protein